MREDSLHRLLKSRIITILDIPETPQKLAEITGIGKAEAVDIIGRAELAR
jgi:hypothetical protein